MKKLLIIALSVMLYTGAQAQTDGVYLNLSAQHDDTYFANGGWDLGVSTITPLSYISDKLGAELGFGFFHKNMTKVNENALKFNVLSGLTYKVFEDDFGAVIIKANFRGYLINDNIKGYFEPTAELQFSKQFSINFAYASEIHPYGFNIPTGRIGIKSKF